MRVQAINFKVILTTIIAIGLTACSVNSSRNKFSNSLEYPAENKTKATGSLECFGDMLTTYRQSGHELDILRLAVVSVNDATNVSTTQSNFPSEIPSDFTDMALSIATKIGGPIRVIHVPSSQELLDAARYGSIPGKKPPFFNTYNSTHYRNDTIQLYGALTEYDRILANKTRDGDLSVEAGGGSGITNLELSATEVVNVARMTMDFRIAYAAAGDVVNNTSSSNTVMVYQRGSDRSFGLSVDGNSIGYSTSSSLVDARHKAIRLLIEWGLIETLGRYTLVPYWKCLPNSKNSQLVNFKDLLGTDNLYNFQTFNKTHNSLNKRKLKKHQLIDMRDKVLMNSVISDFHNAEYLKDSTRRLYRRSEKDTTLILRNIVTDNSGKTPVNKIVDQKSPIEGKQTLRNNLIKQYRRNINYSKLSDSALLKRLHNEFVKAKVINPKDDMLGANTYLALWLNVPVVKGARWRK